VHEAKATGDKQTVDDMLDKYGNRFNTAWRDNIVKRVDEIAYPDLVAMVFAKLVPVFENGKIADVKVDYTESFETQQRRLGRISSTTEISEKVH
jgi:dipeptidyl-peptidase-3